MMPQNDPNLANPPGESPPFNPLSYRLILHRPKMLSSLSSWTGHIPFAFVLVEMLRPSSFVELGVFAGDSYCAFCQAVAELALPTKCVGFDTWQGDPQNGFYAEQIYQQLVATHDLLYSQFSRLVRSQFDAALPTFPDNSIDILHIDGFHSYEAVQHDFQSWRPKLSSRAVVLFHDTRIFDREFGVHRFWREVSAEYPHFEFTHCAGLGVLAVGPQIPAAFAEFLAIAEKSPDLVREVFTELGFRCEVGTSHMHMSMDIRLAHELLNTRARALGQPEADESAFKSTVSAQRLRERIRALVAEDLRQRGIRQT